MKNGVNNLVGLMTDQNPNQLIGILGILKSGNGFVPIDPDYPLERIDFIIRDCGIDLIVTEAKHLDKALRISGGDHQPTRIICLDKLDKQVPTGNGVRLYDSRDFQRSGESELKDGAGFSQTAYLVYTSGSAGKPKGVPITHENLFPLLQWSKQYFKFGERSRTLQSLSYCFDFGIFEILTTALFGGTLYCIDKRQRMDPLRYTESVNREAINTINTTPSFFHELTSRACEMKTLEALHLGGEALMSGAVDEMFAVIGENCVVYNGYGPTETTVNSSIFEVGASLTRRRGEAPTIPIGKASAKNALYILDPDCNLVPEGVPGELYIGGPGLAPAYLNLPELTAQKFIPSRFSQQPGARLYKTGDLVRRLPDGNIEFLGRLDHQVKVRGFRIELGEIETALAEHPSVREVVVLARQDRPGDARLVAYVTPDQRPGPASGELQSFLRQKLPDYMTPSAFVMLDAMPLTPNGKLDRQALPAPGPERPVLGSDFVAPRNPSEAIIAGICADVLGLEEIGIDDNFFDLGCHSLLATKIVLRLREVFQVELPLVRFFENPTIAGLAESLEAGGPANERSEIPPLQPIARDERIPLSFAQERLWFLSQLDPTNVSYHVPRALRIKGPFSVSALEQSFSEIIRRHEILRTTFPLADGLPIQVIHSPAPIEVPVYDLRVLAETECEEHIGLRIRAEGRRPFDLTNGPLLRLSVLRLDDQESIFILVEHHLVHDGWTQGGLARNFLAIYSSMSEGRQTLLPEPVIQYADFAQWQRHWLSGELLENQLAYWKQQLAEAPPVLNLPTDRPRPAVQSFRGDEHTLILQADLAESLRAMSRCEGVTLFMTMLAAFKALLYRYTGQEDMVVGSGIANRQARETEDLLGMVINTIVLRTNLSGSPSFRELLKRARKVCLGAYAHQDLPFERLVEELRPERNLDYNPLFQVVFAFQDTVTPELELPGLTIDLLDAHNQSAKFDLNIVALPRREQLAGEETANVDGEITLLIEYSADLFDRETIVRMAEHYKVMLESAIKDADASITEMEMLTGKERRQLVEEWNETAAHYPGEICAHELFEAQAELTPDAVAVTFGDQELSYRELNERANLVAHHLRSLGIAPETRVAICVERSPEMVIGRLGVLKSGGAFISFDPASPRERLAFMIEDAQVPVLLTQEHLTQRLQDCGIRMVILNTGSSVLSRESRDNPAPRNTPDNLAYVIYTSGTTGKPKGVEIQHGGLVNMITWHNLTYGVTSSDRMSQLSGLEFDASIWELWPCLAAGASIHIPDEETDRYPPNLLEWLAAKAITVCFLSTPLAEAVLDDRWPEGLALRALQTGGDKLRYWPGEDLPFSFMNNYGPTEATVVTTWARLSGRGNGSAPPIGRPIANTRLYALSPNLQVQPVGVPGELFISGIGLARGYLKRPETTAEKFIPNPMSGANGTRMYASGDMARRLSDGNVEYLHRSDSQVKLRGYRIELSEIESVLAQHEGLRQCAVCLREDEPGHKHLVAYVAPSGKESPAVPELRAYLQEKLPDYMTPRIFVELPELPLTANGKLDRRALPAPARAEVVEDPGSSETPVKEILAGIFAEALRLERAGVEENFFELGGHSLLATQVISRVRDALSVELPLRSLFETPTVAGLAGAIERERQTGAGAGPIAPAPRDVELPLSFAQQRLWFIQQLEPESAAYNVPIAVELRGALNIIALKQSLGEIARRHETLRTRFVSRHGRPAQVIDDAGEVEVAAWDLSETKEGEREDLTREIVRREAGRPFNLEQGPVWRATLARLGIEEHILLLSLHHVASDGWSTGVMVKEFSTLYERYGAGLSATLPELRTQYADFAVWQRDWLQSEALDQQLEYWRRQLADVTALELPADKPRPAVASHRGARLDFRFSAELTQELKTLSRREGVTLFMTLLAGFQVALGRHAGQNDVVVGTDVANRNRLETEGLIGFFVNQLVLRMDLSGNPSFRSLLRRVRETTLEAYMRQDLPFERLVEELDPERSLGRSPLFQVKLVLQNTPRETLRMAGVDLRALDADYGIAKFDLTLILTEGQGGLSGTAEYATDLYEAVSIERLLARLRLALEEMAGDSQKRIAEAALLTAAERQQVLVEWNDTRLDYGERLCAHQLFERQAEYRPDAVAVVSEAGQLSYDMLNAQANRLARYLMELGVEAETPVAVCMERSPEMVIALLATLKSGGAYVPLDPNYPAERLVYMLENAQAAALLTQSHLRGRLPSVWAQCLELDRDWEMVSSYPETNPGVELSDANMAYLIYTSGSTGRPKGVVAIHRGVVRLAHRASYVKLGPGETLLLNAPLSFDASTFELWGSLLTGGRLALAPDGMVALQELGAHLKRYGVTTLWLTAALFQHIVEHDLEALSGVRQLLAGGETLPMSAVKKLRVGLPGCQLINGYGPTENTTFSTCHKVEWIGAEARSVAIGKPITNSTAYILDENYNAAPVGAVGEIYVGGDGLARGYQQAIWQTAERFLPHPYSEIGGERLYATGDLGYYRGDGSVEFLGRRDHQVKLRGYRIELEEIEAALSEHAAMKRCAVIMREDEPGEKRLVAYVVPASGISPDGTELHQYLRMKLPEYMAPSAFVELTALPLTPNGKLDRKALPAPAASKKADEEARPLTPVEEIVAGIFAEVLRQERVGVEEDFFDLGGHSLLATQAISRVREALGVEIGLRVLFESPTVAGLAEALEQERRVGKPLEAPSIAPAPRDGRLPLSFAQQRLWFIHQLEPENAVYNIPLAVRLKGALDLVALRQSLGEIVRRHEALRTRFEVTDGRPAQVIDEPGEVDVGVWDLSAVEEGEREELALEIARQEAGRPFDLEQGPVWRVALMRLGAEEHMLLLSLHHVASDGWSMGVMIKEFTTLYEGYRHGRETVLPELPAQYVDYTVWQREWLQGEALERELEYWRKQLEGSAGLLELPAGRSRPATQTYRGSHQSLLLSKSLSEQLQQFSRQAGATLFMTLLTALKILLYRYTGQPDIIVGSPIAGRNRKETEGLIGFFLNTLVLRTTLAGELSFLDALDRARETTLGAYAHQDLPFERIVDELEPQRDLGKTPLFQVMFNMLSFDDWQIELPGLAAEVLPSADGVSKLDLTLYAMEQNGTIRLKAVFNTDLFEAEMIGQMLDHYRVLLEAAMADPTRRISSLPLLSEQTRRDRSLRSNIVRPVNAFVEFPKDQTEQTIHRCFERQVKKYPRRVAVKTKNYEWTYEDLDRIASRMARAILAHRGIGEERVALLFAHDAPMVAGILAVLKAGKTYAPLDPSYPRERLLYILEDLQVGALLTDEPRFGLATDLATDLAADLASAGLQVIRADGDDTIAAPEEDPTEEDPFDVSPNTIAYILYTSGSTGRPKGVMQSHRNVLRHIRNYTNNLHINADDRLTLLASYGFDAAVMDIFGALLNGAAVYPMDLKRDSLADLSEWLVEQEMTIYHSTPTVYRYFFGGQSGRGDFPNIRLVVLGGEEVRRGDVDLYKDTFSDECIFINGLGLTESTLGFQYFVNKRTRITRNSAPVGWPVDGIEAHLLNDAGEQVAVYGIGEIIIRGAHIALGYWNNAEKDKAAFLPDPDGGQRRIYRTGDLGRLLPDGSIEFAGRRDHQVKIRGHRVELGEINAVLGRHSSVRESVVLARRDLLGEKRIVAYVVPQTGQAMASHDLRAYLEEKLPSYMAPWAFVELSELPATPSGKLNPEALPEPATVEGSGRSQAPCAPVEEILRGIWAEVLGVEAVGVQDNFFELGGHSLLATQVTSRVRDALGVEAPLRALFENPTVAGLAEAVERERSAGRLAEAPPIAPAPRDGDLPLSFAQQRLWFIHQLEPDSPAYNIPMAVRLVGTLNISALRQSLREVVRRHEALRTRFVARDGWPRQVIDEPDQLEASIWDISQPVEGEGERRLREVARQEARRPFDLERGPLWRAALAHLGPEDHALLLCIHHAVNDGWSVGVLAQELTTLYEAFRAGDASPLVEPPAQYADFAAWQREWLQGEALEARLSYWRRQLAAAPALELPTDRPRPATPSRRGAEVSFTLRAELTQGLKALSRCEGVTLFMTLLAGFQALLARYSGQEVIAVGTPIAGRNRAEIEGLIGFFVNTLVMRAELGGNPTVRELLRQGRETALGAYAHQDMPFEKLVEELQPQRSLSHEAFFQVMMILQNAPRPATEVSNLRISLELAPAEAAKFDLTLSLVEQEGQIHGSLEYATDLYERERILRMVGHLQRMLEAMQADSDRRIGEISLLTRAERQQVMMEWNETEAEYPTDQSVPELFERQVEEGPDAVAVIYEGQHLSYEDLNRRACDLAHYLRRLGVESEARVGLCLERSPEMVIALLGTLKAGGVYVPLDPEYPIERLTYMLEDAGLSALLTERRFGKKFPQFKGRLLLLDTVREELGRERQPPLGRAAADAAYALYTSGSTGQPKGVIGSHRGAVNRLSWMWETYPFAEGEVCCVKTSLNFVDSVWEIFGPLLKGIPIVMIPDEVVKDTRELVRVLADHRVTRIVLVPSLLRVMMESGGDLASRLTALKYWVSSGEALAKEVIEQFRQRLPGRALLNLYGSSEVAADVTCAEAPELGWQPGASIGRPVFNTEIYLLGSESEPVPIGVVGELHVGGDSLARGYLNRPELTAEKFIPNPFSQKSGARLYRTGDLARYREDGEIIYLGRLDHQVKIHGYRIELGEIESALLEHGEVRQCVVIAREEEARGKRLVAYVAPSREGTVSGPELRAYLQGKLPEYMAPAAFVMLRELPLTPNGKLDRKALPAPPAMNDVAAPGESEGPRTPMEEIVAGIWGEVLGLERVGVNENFFELGGHSLLATQVISRVRDALDAEAPLRALFESPTVAGLAEAVERERRSGGGVKAPPISPAPRDGDLPLSFAQQRLWFIHQLEPDSPAYNIPMAVRLVGTLNISALRQSLREVVRRHEALRTRFQMRNGQPAQIIDELGEVELPVWGPIWGPIWGLDGLQEDERERRARAIAHQETRRPFDLERGPVWRAALIHLGPEDHLLLLSLHHVASDGWSTGVLAREFTALYESYREGRQADLPDLPAQYADFAVWQRQWLQGEALQSQLDYWRRRLAAAPALELPADRPRTAAVSRRGGSAPFQLSKDLTGELKALSRREGVTLFMTLLAAFKVVLNSYSGQEDVVVGTDIANRNQMQTEGLIGFFVNQLVLRTDLTGNPSFRELLRRVREITLDAYAHQDVPFEKLVEELQPDRSLNRTPIFQVLFVLENAPFRSVEAPNLTVRSFALDPSSSTFDWVVVAQETKDGISGAWRYNADIFDASTIERACLRFQTLLEKIVASPETRLRKLKMMTEQKPPDSPRRPGFRGKVGPKTVTLPLESLVSAGYLSSAQTLPLVVTPAVDDIDPVEWAETERGFIERNLLRHGAILFRGFKVEGAGEFERFASAIYPELFAGYGDLPRERVGGKVYGSTPYPNDRAILFHNESSHLHSWPLKIWFYCLTPPQQGGETPVVDCRSLYREMDPALRQKFHDKGLMYVRNFGDGLDVSWRDFFNTSDRASVEEFCRRAGILCEWKAGEALRTKKLCPAVARHPKTGELVFFNQLQAHHVSCLDPTAKQVLLSQFGEEGLPRNVYYGDGERIPDSVVSELKQLYERHAQSFTWREGDILMVDNMLVAHGRRPFVGPRKIVVAMGEMSGGAISVDHETRQEEP